MDKILPGIDDGSIVLVDVRRHEELVETGKIPGSYNVPREFLSLPKAPKYPSVTSKFFIHIDFH